MSEAKYTETPWELEVGLDRCFHKGNRVAITTSGMEGDEPWNVTIAELWPADNDMDIKDGRLMAAAKDIFLMLDRVECYCPVDVQDAIRALRAKATGGNQTCGSKSTRK